MGAEGRPVDLLCRAAKPAVRMVRLVEELLQGESSRTSFESDIASEGLRQPRGTLVLRSLESRAKEGESGETWLDLVLRIRQVVLLIERLPRSLIVLCPDAEVTRALLAHFHNFSKDIDPSELPLPSSPVIELRRDHKGFALHELSLPTL